MLGLDLRIRASVPGNPQLPVQRLQTHVGQTHAGKLHLQDDLFRRLVNVGRGRPERRLDAFVGKLRAMNRVFEEPIHLLLDRHEILE